MSLINFPALLDAFPDVDAAGGDDLNTVGKEHDDQHNKAAQAIVALERLLLSMNIANVMDPTYGAVVGGSATTNTTAINAACTAIEGTGRPGHVIVPIGVVLAVTPGGLVGGADVTVCGGGKLTTTQTTVGSFFTVTSKDRFHVVEIIFSAPNDNMVAVTAIDCAELVITRCRTYECRLVITGTGLYATQNDANACTDAEITFNRCFRTSTTVNSSACIWVYYAIGAKVLGNTVEGFNQGIVWWGGDGASDGALINVTTKALTSNVVTITTSVAHGLATGQLVLVSQLGASFDGLVTVTGSPTTTTFTYAFTAANVASVAAVGSVERAPKCREITIAGNTVRNSAGGGIWGSMGWVVTVTGNTVTGCGDVGIDFERTWTGTATGNTVRDCVGGNFTTFFVNRGINISGNVGTWSRSGVMVRVQNGAGYAYNQDISITGNTFTAYAGISAVSIEPTALLRWNNTCTNCRFDSDFNNQGDTRIEGGTFTFDTVASAAFTVIRLGSNHIGGRFTVKATLVKSSLTQPAGSKGIFSTQDDPVTEVRGWIDDNTIEGFVTAIASEWHGSNAGIVLRLWMRNNTVDVGATIAHSNVVAPAAATAATVTTAGNYHTDGTAA